MFRHSFMLLIGLWQVNESKGNTLTDLTWIKFSFFLFSFFFITLHFRYLFIKHSLLGKRGFLEPLFYFYFSNMLWFTLNSIIFKYFSSQYSWIRLKSAHFLSPDTISTYLIRLFLTPFFDQIDQKLNNLQLILAGILIFWIFYDF